MKNIKFVFLMFLFLAIAGCTKVKVCPTLNSSLSYDAFAKMKTIEIKNASIAIYIDPQLLNTTSTQTIKMGVYSFNIGKSLAVKLIKGLSYQFRTIHIIDTPSPSPDMHDQALMRVQLQDIDTKMDVKPGFDSVSAESYTHLAVRAEIQDINEHRIIWVGTSQVSQTGGVEEKMLTYQEAGRGFAKGFDEVIDKAVGDLLYQMNKSQNLAKYFTIWQQENRG
ncbi:MAG: hypothetical protein PHO79_01195 [Desulfoplanes sp.]|nr:hypothetical protein [Desulfoplanes sp.]MDD4648625.1 hypothetical protein [Desulfoplanes sp.]